MGQGGDALDRTKGESRLPAVALRVAAAVVGAFFLFLVFGSLKNIWGENDSGTGAYVVYAGIYGVLGSLLLLFAIGVLPRRHP
jgi:Na+/melibiose symporter-like transporter